MKRENKNEHRKPPPWSAQGLEFESDFLIGNSIQERIDSSPLLGKTTILLSCKNVILLSIPEELPFVEEH